MFSGAGGKLNIKHVCLDVVLQSESLYQYFLLLGSNSLSWYSMCNFIIKISIRVAANVYLSTIIYSLFQKIRVKITISQKMTVSYYSIKPFTATLKLLEPENIFSLDKKNDKQLNPSIHNLSSTTPAIYRLTKSY